MIEHSIDFEEQHRTVESLRRKFRDLHLKKAPTGDPNMSATVRRAKEINLLIRQKSLVCIDCNETEEEDGTLPPQLDCCTTSSIIFWYQISNNRNRLCMKSQKLLV